MENQEILNSLKNAQGVMLQVISIEEEKYRRKAKIEQLQELINQKFKAPKWSYAIPVVVMYIVLFVGVGGSKNSNDPSIGFMAIFFAGLSWFITGKVLKKKFNLKQQEDSKIIYTPQIDQIQNEIDSLQTQINTVMYENKEVLDILPAKYQYLFAYQKIGSYFEDMRASNLSEAINLYETELHRMKLEENSAKALELQKQTKEATDRAATAAAWAATASTITAIRSFRK